MQRQFDFTALYEASNTIHNQNTIKETHIKSPAQFFIWVERPEADYYGKSWVIVPRGFVVVMGN